MLRCGYGLAKPSQARTFVQEVCDLLGHGSANQAVAMLLETAAQETHMGRYRDPTPNGAGRGLFQIDLVAFEDVQHRARDIDVFRVREAFGIDVRSVKHSDLDFSPLLAAIFCRLFYKLKPEPFPVTVIQRASYWKRHYNTFAGKGTEVDYVRNAETFMV